MKRKVLLICCVFICFVLGDSSAWGSPVNENSAQAAQSKKPDVDDSRPLSSDTAEVCRQVAIGGRSIAYEAQSERMPLFDDEGRLVAWVFYVAYTRLNQGSVHRPVAFVFNGGPGASSLFLHMGALGPMCVKTLPDGIGFPKPPYLVEENPDSLLDQADLVFIDPVGTGFSRAEDHEKGPRFWGVEEDAEWVSQFIRMYLTREKRWGVPVYLIGESYGGMRATEMVPILMEKGIMPSGLVLISPAVSYGELICDDSNSRPFIHTLPVMAAAAWYHGRLSDDLQGMPLDRLLTEVHSWANGPYLSALWAGNGLSQDEFDAVVTRLARYTAMPESLIRRCNLKIPSNEFVAELLLDRKEYLSQYDVRVTSPGGWGNYEKDPMFTLTGAPYYTAFMAYLQEYLQFDTDQEYRTFSKAARRDWDFESGQQKEVGYPNTVSSLAQAMRRNEHFRVFVAMGVYDMVCCPDSVLYSLGRLDVPRERLLRNITVRSYDGGHMMYTNPKARSALKADLSRFLQEK